MNFSFADIPRFVAPEIYSQAIDRMINRLKSNSGVISIYQIGSVSTPGISDIDLLVVFKDKFRMEENPIQNLSSTDKYLFTHNLFGTSEAFVNEVEQYTYFGKYKLLAGKDLDLKTIHIAAGKEKIVKKQIALEYLVKASVTSAIERAYYTVKLRNLFLYAKALFIDLTFLQIADSELQKALERILDARNSWFEHPLSQENLNYLAEQYHYSLIKELNELMMREKFYLPSDADLKINKNIVLKSAGEFSLASEGIFFPGSLIKFHDKLPKLLNRLNHFRVYFPFQQHDVPEIIMARYQFIREMVQYQKKYLPGFIPTAFGLNIFNEKKI